MNDLNDLVLQDVQIKLAEIMEDKSFKTDKLFAATAIVVAIETLVLEGINEHVREYHSDVHEHPHYHSTITGQDVPTVR